MFLLMSVLKIYADHVTKDCPRRQTMQMRPDHNFAKHPAPDAAATVMRWSPPHVPAQVR
jgi:hypothetical protein